VLLLCGWFALLCCVCLRLWLWTPAEGQQTSQPPSSWWAVSLARGFSSAPSGVCSTYTYPWAEDFVSSVTGVVDLSSQCSSPAYINISILYTAWMLAIHTHFASWLPSLPLSIALTQSYWWSGQFVPAVTAIEYVWSLCCTWVDAHSSVLYGGRYTTVNRNYNPAAGCSSTPYAISSTNSTLCSREPVSRVACVVDFRTYC
jgi:hypothetical protein